MKNFMHVKKKDIPRNYQSFGAKIVIRHCIIFGETQYIVINFKLIQRKKNACNTLRFRKLHIYMYFDGFYFIYESAYFFLYLFLFVPIRIHCK